MATVTGLTKDRMLAIEAESIVDGNVDPATGRLILTRHDGTTIDAGYIVDNTALVDLVSDQIIAGVKTFSAAPVVPANAFPETAIANLVADLAAKAADAVVVKLTGAQTIAGVKTFSAAPIVPANSFPESAITNLAADLAARALDAVVLHLAGAETITGAKTFNVAPIVPANAFPESAIANLVADLAAKAADVAVMHLANAETITGVKTFNAAPILPGPVKHFIGAAGEPAFQNAWVNFADGTYENAWYSKDAQGIVRLGGVVKNGAAGAIFTLPAGFRPVMAQMFAAQAGTGTARVDVFNTGNVSMMAIQNGSNAYLGLSPVVFATN